MKHLAAASVRLATALCLLAAPARASQPDLSGLGPRSAALAGTGAADADGYDSAFENPAGAAAAPRARLTTGYIYGHPTLDLDGLHRSVAPTRGLLFGLTTPLPFGGALAGRIGLAVAAFLPLQLVNQARTPFNDEARLVLLDERTQVVTILACAGVRVSERVTLGLGIAVLATLLGEIRIAPDAAGHLVTLAEEEAALRAAPIVGARVRLLDSLRVGAVVRGASAADYDLTIRADLGNALPIKVPTMRIAGVAQYDPLQAALEAAWDPAPHLALRAGATWRHWSAYPHPSERVTPAAPPPLEPGFSDTVTPRVALEYTAEADSIKVQARAGYAFEPTPAPGGSVLVDASRHLLTAGVGLSFGRFQLDAFAQRHQLAGSSRASGSFLVVGGALGMDL